MYTGVNIDKLKILKGPDRLLRTTARFSGSLDIETDLYILAEILDSLLRKHHQLSLHFPTKEILGVIPKGKSTLMGEKEYGSMFNGTLIFDIFLRHKKPSEICLRYYPEDMEFERNLDSINHYISINKIDFPNYEFKYTFGESTNGLSAESLMLDIDYTKSI